ncbi:hypothetical protein QBC35DRAFT_454755 [Podospora australis]|uniref:NmrA-like domain-containing protein n=1 Tax=Podospora australis TaxID=1536484 RepID=A0AAN7AF52_9PEZI|nr:hypothetical protein QBC35DRAFT_454755 [Podospora australis]
MPERVLCIGASGHIGAAVLDLVKKTYPNLDITALVRSHADGKHLEATYTGVKMIQGSLDDLELIEQEAAASQLVINCAPDIYTQGITALLKGLSTPSPDSTSKRFYIHTSGAARVWPPHDVNHPDFTRIWDDLTDLDSFPTDATHAAQDTLVQSANVSPGVFTAIISPSFVVGKSPSVTHKLPIIFPDLMHVVRQSGGAFIVDAGENFTTFVDTQELAQLYLLLVKNALEHLLDTNSTPEEEAWGPRAYYFADSLEVTFKDFMVSHLVPLLKKQTDWIKKNEVTQLSLETVVKSILGRVVSAAGGEFEGANIWSRHIAEGFGTAMRISGGRARKYLGWKTDGRVDFEEAVRALVEEWKADV